MIKKEKPEIKTMDDVRLLPREEQTKWEIANELGYFDKIVASGWKSLTSRENGRIGGVLSARFKKKEYTGNLLKKSRFIIYSRYSPGCPA